MLTPSPGDPVEQEKDVPEEDPEGDHDDAADESVSATAQDIMDMVLPDIARCNARLLEHIKSPDGDPPTKNWWARLRFIDGLYSSARRSLAPGPDYFIDLEVLDERLPGIDHNSESFRAARATLCSANLVSLLKLITQVSNKRAEIRPVIEQIEDGFPVMFDAHLKHGTGIVEATYDLAFRLHCHFLMEALKDIEGNPFVMAVRVFCSEDAPSTVKQAKAMLLAGPYRDFARVDVNGQGDIAKKHAELMKALCSHLSRHKQRPETLRELESAYPVDDFLVDLEVWALTALEDAEEPVDNKGKTPERILSTNPADGRERMGISGEVPKQSSLFVEEDGSDSDSEPEEAESIIRAGAPA